MARIDRPRSDALALRHALERRRRELTEDFRVRVARIRDRSADIPQVDTPDEDSTDLDVTLVEIATHTIQLIDAALERLERGQYGRCARCRGRISKSRLRAMPFAVLCRECQAVREREAALDQANRRPSPWDRVADGPPTLGRASGSQTCMQNTGGSNRAARSTTPHGIIELG